VTLVGALAAGAACSSDGSSGDGGDAGDAGAGDEPAGPVPGVDVARPTVTGPVTGGTHDLPFNAMPVGLAERYGYVEDEYLLAGEATAYRAQGELGEDGRGGQHAVGRHHGVDEAEGARPLGADGVAGEGDLQGDGQRHPDAGGGAAAGREQARLTSGNPNRASQDATMRSQPRSSSKPPATAVAFAAPITGTPTSPRVSRKKPAVAPGSSSVGGSPSAKARRSMPAQKARLPVPVRTTNRISGSASASFSVSPMLRISAASRALRVSGRFRRATRTLPRRSRTSERGLDGRRSLSGRSPWSRRAPPLPS
jgi:hypothetical protein